MLFYSDKIFKGDKPDELTPSMENIAKIFTVVTAIILIISSYISGIIIDKFGRR